MRSLLVRQLHAYIGLFIAPSVLFFALTGTVQLFDLHEAHDDYRPFALVEKLSSVHKSQKFAFGDHHDEPAPGSEEEDKLPTVLLRWFFLLVALCLVVSTTFGLWMGLTQSRRKPIAWVLLAAGALIPLGLLVS